MMAFSVVGSIFLPNISQLVDNPWKRTAAIPSLAYLTLSLSINVVLSTAIVIRLCLFKRQVDSYHALHMYNSVVFMIIESALPYGIVALLTVVACGTAIPMQTALLPMLGQLQVDFKSVYMQFIMLTTLETGNSAAAHNDSRQGISYFPGRSLSSHEYTVRLAYCYPLHCVILCVGWERNSSSLSSVMLGLVTIISD